MRIRKLVVLILLCHFAIPRLTAQELSDSTGQATAKITRQYISALDGKAARTSENIDKQTEKYLAKLEKQESVLKDKLARIDSVAAIKIFANAS